MGVLFHLFFDRVIIDCAVGYRDGRRRRCGFGRLYRVYLRVWRVVRSSYSPSGIFGMSLMGSAGGTALFETTFFVSVEVVIRLFY